MLRALASVLFGLLLAMPAHAAWLVDLGDAVTRTDLASREAPVVQYDYDGRAHGSLGGTLRLWQDVGPAERAVDAKWTMAWEVSALAAVDNASTQAPWPSELARLQASTRVRLTSPARNHAKLELDVGLWKQSAVTLGNYALPERPRQGDIAFGGGGTALDAGIGWTHRHGAWEFRTRLGDRLHLPGLLLALQQRAWADVVGDALGDNVVQQVQVDALAAWHVAQRLSLLAAVHYEVSQPLDDMGKSAQLFRMLAGPALRTGHGTWLPFVSADVGAGPGLLLNRQEIRFGIGVRHVP